MRNFIIVAVVCSLSGILSAQTPDDGSVLPFPPSPMAGVAKPRLQDSTMKWPQAPQRLPKDAPNILIVFPVTLSLLARLSLFGVDFGRGASCDVRDHDLAKALKTRDTWGQKERLASWC